MAKRDMSVVCKSARILLLNSKKELLLMSVNDPDFRTQGMFWCTIGGKMEAGETLLETARRELEEETGLAASAITWGPCVASYRFARTVSGTHTHFKQRFVVAHTNSDACTLDNLTTAERAVVQGVAWWSVEALASSQEVIYPIGLADFLPSLVEGRYPASPFVFPPNRE